MQNIVRCFFAEWKKSLKYGNKNPSNTGIKTPQIRE
jgi:hypothetical protein